MRPWVAGWDPVIAGLVAASRGETQAAAAVREYLASYDDSPDWAALARVLRRVLDRDYDQHIEAILDRIGAVIISRALGAISGRVTVPAELWPAMRLGPLLSEIVAVAHGDTVAVARVVEAIDALAENSELSALTQVLKQILDGERDPSLAAIVGDPSHRAVIATVLEHIGADGPEGR